MNRRQRPGFMPARLARLCSEAIERLDLRLDGRNVLTEAANGAYAVTPVLAALAGADKVVAVGADTRYGSFADSRAEVEDLAKRLGVMQRIEIVDTLRSDHWRAADVVTNSGHVRPIDAHRVDLLKPTAVIPTMYEAWELRESDIDLAACRKKGIAVAGTNERHQSIDVFSFLGMMAVHQLHEAGVAVYRSRIALLVDNDFGPYIREPLLQSGAQVLEGRRPEDLPEDIGDLDAVLCALAPRESGPVLGPADADRFAKRSPTAVICQYWGDIDRPAFERNAFDLWPESEPGRGHMGVLPSEIGPEPIVRLQAGGLKVAEVLLIPSAQRSDDDLQYLLWITLESQ